MNDDNNKNDSLYSEWNNNQNNIQNENTNNVVNQSNTMYTKWQPGNNQSFKPEEKPYIVLSDKELKNKKRLNVALRFVIYGIFIIVGALVFYMYQMDKYEFYPKEQEVLIANKSSHQVELTPKNARYFDYLNYKYEIENNNIADVNEYGEIKAKEVGETNLKIKYKNGFNYKTVKVKVENVEVEKIDLKNQSGDDVINIDSIGGSKVNTVVNDNEKINIDVEYTSSDDEIVSVDEYGNISANKPGVAVIYGETVDGIKGETKVEVKESVIEVEKIELEENNITVKLGSEAMIIGSVKPSNAQNKELSYEVDNDNISVSPNGNIKGLKIGKSVVKVKSNNNISAYCTVNVISNEIKLESLKLSLSNISIKTNEEQQLTMSYIPSNTTERDVVWESSDPNILSVTNGKIKGLAEGTVSISVKSKDGKISDSTVVTVKNDKIEVTGINIDNNKVIIKNGSEFLINASVIPSDATNKKLSYKCNNDNASVDTNGLVKAKKVGNSIITITSSNGISVNKEIEIQDVSVEATGITLNNNQLDLNISDNYLLSATIEPTNTTVRNITWTSSNSNVASVVNGKVIAKSSGVATITAKTSNGKMATCKVNVFIPVTSLSISGLDEIKVKKETNFNVSIEPANASNKTIIWSSDNESVAVVNNGKVTGVGVGYATITAKSNNGIAINKVIKVSIDEVLPVSIQVNPNAIELFEGKTVALSAIINPNNSTNKTITWSSNNPNIAIVSQDGVVTGINSGTTKIVAKTINGKISECEVRVLKNIIEVDSIVLSTDKTEINVLDSIKLSAIINPDNATNKSIVWNTSNPDIVSVNNGEIVGLKAGTAIVSVSSNNGKFANCVVLVKDKTIPVESVNLSKNKVSLLAGGTYNLINYVSVSPSNATNQNIVWSSSNNKIATVENGKITAKKAGTATIYASSADGSKKSSASVTVQDGELEMYFINLMNGSKSVPKSDTIFIKVGNKSMIIDGGFYEHADKVINYLKNTLKVSKIDYYIGSHNHNDHVGAAGPLIKEFGIKTVYIPSVLSSDNVSVNDEYYHEYAVLRKMLKEVVDYAPNANVKKAQMNAIKNCTIKTLDGSKDTPSVININGLRIITLGPTDPGRDDGNIHTENNRQSLILRMEFGNTSYLFPGDTGDGGGEQFQKEYYEIEKKFPGMLDVDVYKNGHHYSAKSSTTVNLITPKITIFTHGYVCDNFPPQKYLNLLDGVNSKYYYVGVKDKSCEHPSGGTVILTSDGTKIKVKQNSK